MNEIKDCTCSAKDMPFGRCCKASIEEVIIYQSKYRDELDWSDCSKEAYERRAGTRTYETRILRYTRDRMVELERLVGIGAKRMRERLDEDLCECENGHTCGKTELRMELAAMDAALATSKEDAK